MYKNLIFACGIFVLASSVLAISLIRTIYPQLVFSRTPNIIINLTPTPSISPTPTPVDYYLPYPGILPDHFLWPLKALRDNIFVKLTFSSFSKAEKLLHLADKRIGAAEALINGGQFSLGASVALKAGKYLEQALIEEQKASSQNQNTDKLLEKLAKSALKHQEILNQVAVKVTPDVKPTIDQALQYIKMAYDTTAQRLNEKNQPVPGK